MTKLFKQFMSLHCNNNAPHFLELLELRITIHTSYKYKCTQSGIAFKSKYYLNNDNHSTMYIHFFADLVNIFYFYWEVILIFALKTYAAISNAHLSRVWKRIQLSGSCLSTISKFGSTQLSHILMSYRCSNIFLTK